MPKFLCLICCISFVAFQFNAKAQLPKTKYEASNFLETGTYHEVIDYYKQLAKKSKYIQIIEEGQTDFGLPLHTVILSKNKVKSNKIPSDELVILINNGIHPGESEGIDASLLVAKRFAEGNLDLIPKGVTVVIIPVYNIGGAMNRGSFSRANQNGPKEYGFRGNSKNLDLNRDFIKMDSENAKSFAKIFAKWKPHLFIDTHTSNGADYQYIVTLIETQKDKLGGKTGKLMSDNFTPKLYSTMNAKGFPMIPYMNTITNVPDSGIVGFLETPRYSTGYTSLFSTISYTLETHMLKAYKPRVEGSIAFIETIISESTKQKDEIIEAINADRNNIKEANTNHPIYWELDSKKYENIDFLGYKAIEKASLVTGMNRLFYDTLQKTNIKIPFYNTFNSTIDAKVPAYYLLPKAYREIAQRLSIAGVQLYSIENEVNVKVESYKVDNYLTVKSAYEGHYMHYNTEFEKAFSSVLLDSRYYVIPTNQVFCQRLIVETLEPNAPDSYFNWNFFDGILQQKEYFSAYVFEDVAFELLKNDKNLKAKFDEKKSLDVDFSKNSNKQLQFIYQNSSYFEKTYMVYPVLKVYEPLKNQKLKLEPINQIKH